MKRVDDKHYQYTFTDLAPGKQFLFNFCVNDDYVDRFGRGADQTDYGFDVPTRIFRYPHGYNPPSNPLNLTEPNITVPPDGYTYDVTVSLDLTNYDEDDPGNVYGYAEYTLTLERKYKIKSEDDWNTFCNRLGDNDTYNRFSGETVSLENDITVSKQAGYSQHDFCGIFDGQGHTLTFNYNGSGSDDYVAPFHYISNTKPLGSSEDDPDAPVTIKNLKVKSTIKNSGAYAAGLIGQCWGKVNVENCAMDIDIDTDKEYAAGFVGKNNTTFSFSGCTVDGTIKTSAKFAAGFVSETSGVCNITDCVSGLKIDSSVEGDGTHGGFIGVQKKTNGGNITMKGCVFSGSLLGDKTNSCGGFIGWRNKGVTIYDSIFAPESVTVDDSNSAMFVRNLGTTQNSYYLYALGEDSGNQWKQGYTVTAGEKTAVNLGDIAKHYRTSNIKAGTAGIQYNGVIYAGVDDNVSLSLHSTPERGWMLSEYSVNEGTLTGEEDPFGVQEPYTLEMPAVNVVVTANFKEKPMIVGDIDLNAQLTILDVTVIQKYLVEAVILDEDQIDLSNTNGDETIDIAYATLLQLKVAEYDVELVDKPTPPTILPTDPVPTSEPTTAPPPVENTVQFVDNLNWGIVYVYAKNSDGDELCGAWPGTRITNTEINDFNETLFIFNVPAGASSMVINNGDDKRTVEITYFDVAGYYLPEDTDELGHYIVEWWKQYDDE